MSSIKPTFTYLTINVKDNSIKMSAMKLIFDLSIAKITTQQPATPPPPKKPHNKPRPPPPLKNPEANLKKIQNIETTAD